MRRVVVVPWAALLLLAGGTQAQWKPGSFGIYFFAVGQADSQLIVSPSGKTLLVDLGETDPDSHAGASYVAGRLREIMGKDFKKIDFIVATHLHLDHIGQVGSGGIWYLLEKEGFSAGTIVDRDAAVWKDLDGNGVCDDKTEIVWKNAGTTSGTARKWVCWVGEKAAAGKLNREIAIPGSSGQIDLGAGVTVKIVQSDARGVMMTDGKTPVAGDRTKEAMPPSENDYSITLKISFGKLDYVTGGDTTGINKASKKKAFRYDDVESVIAPQIGNVEVIKVNHHGSSHSSNASYVGALDPDVSLLSCGKDNPNGHPGQGVLDRLLETSAVYMAGPCDPGRNYKNAVFTGGDVVLVSGDGEHYTVNGDAFTARDAKAASDGWKAIRINEVLPAPKAKFTKEFVELYNPTAKDIPIGGLLIDDAADGGSKPFSIPKKKKIKAGGFYTWGRKSFFDDGGDSVRLIAPDGTVIDAFSYGPSRKDESWIRLPDGGAWEKGMSTKPTPGKPNMKPGP